MRACLLICSLLLMRNASAQLLTDDALRKIAFDEKPGASISLNLPFHDEEGNRVRLGQYFDGKPVILDLGYYECPMLCSLVANGMVSALQDIKPQMGRDYVVLNVSIDPREGCELAAAKKKSYVTRFGQTGAANGWHFLTGDEPAIRQLASDVGFQYIYDPASRQFAHPSGLVILSPQGKISHYLSGVVYSPADVTKAIEDASAAKVGSPVEQIFLLCFHYSPITGKYSAVILTTVRVVSLAILATLVALVAGAWRLGRSARLEKG